MKKILFPTDFSENSLNAFAYALQLAKKLNAEILTLHVYPYDENVFADYSAFLALNYNISEWSDFENYKSEVPKLNRLIERQHATSVKVSHILERGDVVEKILKVGDLEHIDLIILGTKGATGLKEVFLGTVAERLVNRASGKVLAIPPACKFPSVCNILLLAKFEAPYLKILHQVLSVADLLGAHIDVLQIKDTPDKNEARTIKAWSREFSDADISFHMLATKEVEDVAIDFAETHNNNIVALAVHEKGFFEKLFFFSLSRQMAFHSTIPVLAIHSKN